MKCLLSTAFLAGALLLAAGPARCTAQNVPGQCVDTPYSASCEPSGGNTSTRPSAEDNYEAKEYSRFVSAHNNALKLYNKAIDAPLDKALGMFQAALADIDEALQHQPGDEGSLRLRRQIQASLKCADGRLAAANGNYDQAIAFLREAEQIFPESDARWESFIADFQRNALWARGLALNRQSDFAGAEAIFRQIIAADPSLSGAYVNLYWSLYNEGRYEDALAALQQAHNLDPRNQDTVSRIADVQSKIDEARAEKMRQQQTQALEQQDSAAAATISAGVGNLIDNIGSGDGQTRSIYRMVNGTPVEFTVLGHPESGPSTALGQLSGIAAGDQKAKDSTRNQGADSVDQLQLGFDTAGNPGQALAPIEIGGQGSGQPPVYDAKTMKAIEDDAQYKQLMKDKADADQRYQQLGGKLKEVNTQIASQQGDTGALQVKENQILDQMAAAKSDANTARVKAEDRARNISFTLNFTETPAKPKPAPPPSPAPGAGRSPEN